MRSLDDLTMYVYGLVEEPQGEDLEAHLDACEACKDQVLRIRAEHRLFQGALVRQMSDALVREQVIDDVLARLPSPPPSMHVPRSSPPPPTGVVSFLRLATTVAAAFCLSVVLATFEGRPKPGGAAPASESEPRREVLACVQDAVVGSIFAQDEEGRPVGELGLQSHAVSVEIQDGIAKTTVEENFQNHTDRRLEGTFRFPLPPDASISRLALEVNGKIEEGTCLERERAREVFESIVSKMKDPALLEWMPGGIFQCRIFPIEPRSTKRVIVAYTQVLPFFRGRMSYVYPLVSEKTRTHPPEELRIEVRARSSGTIRGLESPSHRVEVRHRDRHEASVTYAAANLRPKNDFILTFETADDELRLVAHKQDGEDGTFALFLTPAGAPERKPSRYVFLLDISASVTAPELEVQKRLVRAMMENRIPGDRFEIVAANIESVSSGEVDLRAANDFMDRLRPLGGSDLLAALRSAPDGEIIYIGKGAPTFGETEPSAILEAVKGRRIRTIGVGSRANVDLLQKLGGHFRVNPSDDISRRVAEIAATLGSPVLSGITVEGDSAIYDVVGVRDLFYGERAVVTGRYRGPAAKMIVSGNGYRREFQTALPAKEEGNNFVRRLWAQRKIADLTAQGESKRAEITDLGVKHQIMTPYTSFLVLENEQMWKDYRLKREVQAQDRVLGAQPVRASQSLEALLRMREEQEKRDMEESRRAADGPGFTRFTLVSNGAVQSIDLPRLTPSRETITYAEVRTTTNQFGGLEFTLGEAARARVYQDGPIIPVVSNIPILNNLFETERSGPSSGAAAAPRIIGRGSRELPEAMKGMGQSALRVHQLRLPAPVSTGMYTAKIEEGKTINGRPLQPAILPTAIRRSAVWGLIEQELSRDAQGRILGRMEFDPQTNCFILVDTKAVLDQVDRLLQTIDVEPEQTIQEFRTPDGQSPTIALILRGGADDAVRRARKRVTITARNTTLGTVLEEFGAQTGWTLLTSPEELRKISLPEFIADDDPAWAALHRLAGEAGLAVQERPDRSFVISRKPRITITARDEDIRLLLARLALDAGVRIETSPKVQGKVTASVSNVPWDEALQGIARTLGFVSVSQGPGRVRVIHTDELKTMENRVFPLKYLEAGLEHSSELEDVLVTLLSRDAEGRTKGRLGACEWVGQTLVTVIDTPAVRAQIEEMAALLDVAPGTSLPPVSSRGHPPSVWARIEEARRRLAAPADVPRRDADLRLALRRLGAELERFHGGGRIEVDVIRAFATPGEVVLAGGSRAGLYPGQTFAVRRGPKFIAFVRVLETSESEVRAEVWRGLALSAVLPGDRAERVRDQRAYIAGLPESERRELASIENLETIRAKMELKE